MGFRFQKRIRIFKGLTLNLSKSGSSWTVGGPGASVNLRGDKVTGSVGIPGTGLSYRQSLDNPETTGGPGTRRGWGRTLFWLVLVALGVYLLAR
ncbi:MAG: DUF4236 domain-containing protein [Fimbriimonadaceae bacterium]|nr:DUF4236 domain-containing protein [Fimbriimonadaceae bacterium]